ncbi:unnamed protein product (macronuclear) [Paramecium tetraurelia]|uniref:non-specific serine/threonine protein kinase n=1 Tax=Paramecium tetraurelia TaxID=5888 RepID=A0C2B1_PARTE|nr:uncharacterized protein GSPATT00034405001 [Paramecium tetraurelia]CAK64928.1 unnamed protein product [Paramecium tetraurelia]|eukprot:XP_001432325.1 hypothetical protein (macronuclear) [Paramecium tetraurelia strain d4-2]
MRKHTSPYRNQKPGSSLIRVLYKPEQQTRDNSIEKKVKNFSPIRFILNSRHNSFEYATTNVPQTKQSIIPTLSRKHFQLQYIIGIGGFGRVWKVIYKQQYYAMKEMSKTLVIYKRSVASVINELRLLENLNHSFIVNAVAAFQDKQNIYLVLDYLQGGDLRYHLGRNRRFNEEQTKFFICCVIVGLEYLHSHRIIHRDLKPENLVLDSKGYVRITDLGVAKQLDTLKIDTSGTPGYMAPEVMCGLEHGIPADYYSLGVIAYEFMFGKRPYYGQNRKEIRDAILAKQVQIKQKLEGWSLDAIDFINKLIQRKPSHRLTDVKNHPWIRDYPWDKLINKVIQAPYVPLNNDNFDVTQIQYEDQENQLIINQTGFLISQNQNAFEDYYYVKEQRRRSSLNRSFLLK